MRKRTVRNGMRLILAALIMIVLASFFNVPLSEIISLSSGAENRIYRIGLFWAAAIGGYGVVVTVFGFVLSPHKNDARIRLMPVFIGMSALIFIFFYLFSSSINAPARDEQRRVRPGETITI
ncbi:MAG: hypothetical protein WCI45_12635 [Desulfuromonadales bacterium]